MVPEGQNKIVQEIVQLLGAKVQWHVEEEAWKEWVKCEEGGNCDKLVSHSIIQLTAYLGRVLLYKFGYATGAFVCSGDSVGGRCTCS